MTHANSNNPKRELHKALAISSWRKRLMVSPLLHIQHQSTTMICRFLRLSKGRILPKAASQAKPKKKKTLSKEPYFANYASKERKCYHGGFEHYRTISHQQSFLRGVPTKLVHTVLSQSDGVQLIKE